MRTAHGKAILKERLAIGERLAACLQPKMTQEEVGEILGVSATYVSYVERLALWKIAHRMRQLDSITHPLDRIPEHESIAT